MLRWTLAALALLSASAAAQPAPSQPACALSPADQAWIDSAMRAWNYTTETITGVGRVKNIQAVFFDSSCVVTSETAMNGGPNVWTSVRHDGEVTLPTGEKIPVGVTSFAKGEEDKGYFVMSTPSIWRSANIPHNNLGSLETLMTVVVVHEGHHVAQVPTYGRRIGAIAEKNQLPESFNDDSIQEQFRGNKDFTASVWREVDLFLAAAEAPDRATALVLARKAREMMRTRQARWYVGKDAYLAEAEDVFLTIEGSAQWAAYQWAVDPKGGNVAKPAAFHSFGRRRGWWSQDEGFALFMALDRLSDGSWKRHAFGDGAKTALQMFDEALAAPGPDSSTTGILLIGNKGENSVSFVDLATGTELGRQPTGNAPHEIAISPDGRRAAVVAYGGTTVDLFDVATRAKVKTIDLSPNEGPHGIAWLDDGRLIVTAERSQSLTVADPASGRVTASIKTDQQGTHMVAVSSDGRTAYTSNIPAGTVSVVDLARGRKLRDLAVGGEPEGIALSRDGRTLWVADLSAPRVQAFDASSFTKLGEVATGAVPIRVAVSPDGRWVVTSNLGSGSITVIDAATRRRVRDIAVSGDPDAGQVTILFSADGSRIYAAETGRNTVAEIDFASGRVLRRLPAGTNGDGLAIAAAVKNP